MQIRKNLGIMLIILGFILTMDQTSEFNGILQKLTTFFENYWPLVLVFIGIYLWGEPRKKK
ncbi:LiaF transmembrane domain-containing protein [Beduini massiliensis]|uniref:LiaF transmembrane domain-containing protein n=1 Tax=Beduini massiliensis TaxID=1585974 RepID=UPI00059A9D06|nr:DUF5668 domain-containing protein [Beduini massiliensis]